MLDDIARRAMQSHVKASLKKIPKNVTKAKPKPVIKAPLVKEVTGGDLSKKSYVEMQLRKLPNIGRPNYGPRAPGKGVRAQRPTKTKGARSIIASEPMGMIKRYPQLKYEINMYMREAYTHARIYGDLKGFKDLVMPDGRRFRPKPSQSAFQGLILKAADKAKRKIILDRRSSRENPWTQEDARNDVYRALLKINKEHHFDRLMQLMKQQHKAKVDTLGGKTKGHFISLDNGGLDVAENFGPQAGKSRFKIVNGKKVEIPGNYSEKADSTVGFGAGKGVNNWDDYVRMKLPELE